MKFCPKCKSLLLPKKGQLVCSCGYKEKGEERIVITERMGSHDLDVVDEEDDPDGNSELPIVCWNCGNRGVTFWMVQMRRADEAPTRFYKCRKCRKVWRSGK